MNRAMFTGLSGALAYQSNLDVIANNIVNANTTGYKEARTVFKDVFYHTVRAGAKSSESGGGINPSQVGSGVAIGGIQMAMTQGALQQTSQPLDAAVDGNGFFVLEGPQGMVYSREGAFTLDDSNTLVSANTGLRVQGWPAVDGVVDTSTPMGEMVFPVGELRPASATTEMRLKGNLDAAASIGEVVTTGIAVYDSLGVMHQVNVECTKSALNTWDAVISCGADTANGSLTFDANGALTGGSPIAFTLNPTTGAASPQTIDVDFSAITQLAQSSTGVVQSQDGYAAAALVHTELADGGEIWGRYADGRTDLLGQVALASFVNAAGLQRMGNNLYSESLASGVGQIGTPGTGSRGNIVARSLELANVDLTKAFIDMITTQRSYQASANVISAANRMLERALEIAQR